ncbi:MAG TPA: hypothetical protein VE862_04835 [Candidatus Acidoferrum sp.]|nr:hypothetical protein [Candidatus Acidoferrum sp.]
MAFLIVVFASEKAKLLELEEKIISAIKKRGIQVEATNVETEQGGILTQTTVMSGKIERVPLLKHTWKLPLLSTVDEATLVRLRKDLSGYEVQEIYVTT